MRKKESPDAVYQKQLERSRRHIREISAQGRDIGDLPEIAHPKRKAKCRKDFRAFCESYFPETFALEWSEDHLKVMKRMEECVLHGGLFALAMPRGSGKTSLNECLAIWATAYGHREFVLIIGATETA